jgi:hypothetical protein
MVHAKIEPHDNILLLEILAIEELVEVDHRVVHILTIVWMTGTWLGVLLLCNKEIVCEGMHRIDKIA